MYRQDSRLPSFHQPISLYYVFERLKERNKINFGKKLKIISFKPFNTLKLPSFKHLLAFFKLFSKHFSG